MIFEHQTLTQMKMKVSQKLYRGQVQGQGGQIGLPGLQGIKTSFLCMRFTRFSTHKNKINCIEQNSCTKILKSPFIFHSNLIITKNQTLRRGLMEDATVRQMFRRYLCSPSKTPEVIKEAFLSRLHQI